MRKLLPLILPLLLLASSAYPQSTDVPTVKDYVEDNTGTLSFAEIKILKQKLAYLEQTKGSQLVVKIVSTTHPYTIEQYALAAAHGVVGRKGVDDGALLLIAKDDRKLRIEVGYGLEGAIPDAYAKRIINQIITPQFRSGNFYSGISAGVDALVQLINGEDLPPPTHRVGKSTKATGITPFFIFLQFGFIVVGIAILKKKIGKGKTALVSLGVNTLFGLLLIGGFLGGIIAFFMFLFSLVAIFGSVSSNRPRGGGNWRSGGGWHSGGGFSGGSFGGGFSGGGGSFGGGGASGGW